jgi:hypothetical protein
VEPAQRIECCADAAPGVNLRVGKIAGATARQPHQQHAADDIEPGHRELCLEVQRRVVHVLGDCAGAQHDAQLASPRRATLAPNTKLHRG